MVRKFFTVLLIFDLFYVACLFHVMENPISENKKILMHVCAGQTKSSSHSDDDNLIANLEVKKEKKRSKLKAPLFITVGPQCSGKTTWLESSIWGGEKLQIVAIDDHPAVYYPVGLSTFLEEPEDCVQDEECKADAMTKVEGETLNARLNSPEVREARAVAWFLLGEIDKKELYDSVEPYFSSYEMLESFVLVLESIKTTLIWETETIDLFLPEAVFPRGIKGSKSLLTSQACAKKNKNIAVAWGNTNTQSKAYATGLEVAQKARRPVKFVRWGHELEAVDMTELWRRNALRFAKSGRYIPNHLFQVALSRTHSLYERSNNGDPQALAALAGYKMDSKGYVEKIQLQTEKKKNHRSSPQQRKTKHIDPLNFVSATNPTNKNKLEFRLSQQLRNAYWGNYFRKAMNVHYARPRSRMTTCFISATNIFSYSKLFNPALSSKQQKGIRSLSPQKAIGGPNLLSYQSPYALRRALITRWAKDEWGRKREWRRSQFDIQDMDIVFHQYDVEDRTIFPIVDEEELGSIGKPKRNDSALTREWDTWQLVKQIRSGKYRIK